MNQPRALSWVRWPPSHTPNWQRSVSTPVVVVALEEGAGAGACWAGRGKAGAGQW